MLFAAQRVSSSAAPRQAQTHHGQARPQAGTREPSPAPLQYTSGTNVCDSIGGRT